MLEHQAHEPPFDCLVISDLRLGSVVCQPKLLVDSAHNTVEMVNNGDIFDDLNFKPLSNRHFSCLKVIRRNSGRDDFPLTWVRGNHDGPTDIVGHVVGVDILDEYIYRIDQVKLLIHHCDQFAHFITDYKLITHIGCRIFYFF